MSKVFAFSNDFLKSRSQKQNFRRSGCERLSAMRAISYALSCKPSRMNCLNSWDKRKADDRWGAERNRTRNLRIFILDATIGVSSRRNSLDASERRKMTVENWNKM